MAETNVLTFAQACEFLGLPPDGLADLRERGLVTCDRSGGRQSYPQIPLEIMSRLLRIGHERTWGYETLACYVDLVFAAEVGRAILVPMVDGKHAGSTMFSSWLETPYAAAVASDLDSPNLETAEGPFIAMLRSIAVTAVGENQFWPTYSDLEQSGLYPIIQHFESSGIPILNQDNEIARDAVFTVGAMVLAFGAIAPPVSTEFQGMTRRTYDRLHISVEDGISADERALILQEAPQIAVDTLYQSKAIEIHSPSAQWDFRAGVLKNQKQSVAIEAKLNPDAPQEMIDNIIDLVAPYLGVQGSRVLRLLYTVANDKPYWRTPVITVKTNDLLDQLGYERDDRGFHRSKNRAQLRDILNAAHALEIVGEYSSWEEGKPVRKAFRKSVLSLIGATFDADESAELSTSDLFHRGLPKSMTLRLNFFDSVRRPDGRLGDRYTLMPRLGPPQSLKSARHSATEETLKAYLLLRQRQTRNQTIVITRSTALEKANITTKHTTRATQILTRALDKLVGDGTLESYTPVPSKAQDSFTVIVSEPNSRQEAAH